MMARSEIRRIRYLVTVREERRRRKGGRKEKRVLVLDGLLIA